MNGASSIRLRASSEVPARIEIIIDCIDNVPVVILEIPACEEEREITADLPANLTGIHDLYFRFTESGTAMLEWQFQRIKQ